MSSRMRNGRIKIIVGTVVLLVFVIIVFVGNNTYSELDIKNRSLDKLQQSHDSLTAQLQVVYEHKSRLEKSLNEEKIDNKKNKELIVTNAEQHKEQLSLEKLEASNKFTSLEQEFKLLKNQQEDLQQEFDQLTKNNYGLVSDKTAAENNLSEEKHKVRDLQERLDAQQTQIQLLEQQSQGDKRRLSEAEKLHNEETQTLLSVRNKNTQLKEQLQLSQYKLESCQQSRAEQPAAQPAKAADDDGGVLPLPNDAVQNHAPVKRSSKANAASEKPELHPIHAPQQNEVQQEQQDLHPINPPKRNPAANYAQQPKLGDADAGDDFKQYQ